MVRAAECVSTGCVLSGWQTISMLDTTEVTSRAVLCTTLVSHLGLLHVIPMKVLYDVQHVYVLSVYVGSRHIQYWWQQLHIHLHMFWCCDAFTDTQHQ